MRTGSIGDRNAETMIKTLVEPKRSILTKLRQLLLDSGFVEEPGYDPINVESFVSYSASGTPRFILKFKWDLAAFVVLQSQRELDELMSSMPEMEKRQFEQNSDDGTLWLRLDASTEGNLLSALANFYGNRKNS
jgi:uncharacterized protein (UPF0297 family)